MLLSEHRVGRWLTTTGRRAVHDIVMEQRKGVQQLERAPRVDDTRRPSIATTADESPVTERRPKSLASGKDQAPDLMDWGDQISVEASPPRGFRFEQRSESIVDRPRDRRQ